MPTDCSLTMPPQPKTRAPNWKTIVTSPLWRTIIPWLLPGQMQRWRWVRRRRRRSSSPRQFDRQTDCRAVDTAVQSRGAPWADYITDRISLAGQANMDPNQMTHGTAMMDTLWDMLGKTLNDPGSASLGFLLIDRTAATHHHDVRRRQRHRNGGQSGAKVINLSLAGSGTVRCWTKRWSRRTTWRVARRAAGTMAAPRPIFPPPTRMSCQ